MSKPQLFKGMLGLSGFLLATHGSAATTPIEVEVGGEYHFQLFNTNDGLKAEGAESKETDFAVKAAKIALKGKLSDSISWNVLYQLDTSKLERYWLSNKVSDNFEVSIGVMKIKTYGWHRKISSSATNPIRGAILNSTPLTDKMAVDFVYKMAGTLSLSFVKDYFDPAGTCASTGVGCKSWNGSDVQKQPAVVFEWIGSYGDFQPLVQYSSYDRNHSSAASVGVRYKNDLVESYLDYTLDTRNNKGVDALGKAEDQENKITGIVAYAEYFAGDYTPYFLFSTLDYDQYVAPGSKDIEINKDGVLDDNEQTASLGTYYEGYGKSYRPYVGLALISGNYADPKDATKEENRTRTDIMVGLTGKF